MNPPRHYTHQRTGWSFQRKANGELWIQVPGNELAINHGDPLVEVVLTREEWQEMVGALGLFVAVPGVL